MYNIGSIILMKYFIFNNRQTKKIDHAKFRPCIVICEDEENIYILPISSSYNKINPSCQYQIPSKYIDNNKPEYVDFDNIYTSKICGYPIKDDIDVNDLYDLLINFYQYHKKNNNNKLFNNIENIIYSELTNLNNKIQKNKHGRR